ncbi:proteinase-activated receptor 4 [Brienomyrus brachyistius]|uniref:proteinase-activated receptor 4 n=1 Tax=Brienomyrus brachyistius TaxID=42636 RepID=UPI0020B2429C|nr:proteinase-activated receptor 4 [Brienomyrus brachyistius]
MARPPATPALQLLLALSWILGGQSSLTASMAAGNASEFRPRMFGLIEIKELDGILTLVSEKQKLEIQSSSTVIVVPVLYLITFLVGLPANILALWVLIFHTQKAPSTILLINLTVLDVLLLLILPFRITYHFAGNDWFFSEPLCRLVIALLYGSMYGSMLCLALISIDRYIALVHPFGALTLRSHRTSLAMSVSVWVVVLLAMLPLLLFRQSYQLIDPPINTCHDAQPTALMATFFFPYYASLFSLCFLLPLLVIVFCHGSVLKTLLARGHRYSHAACLTALVLLVFLACFLPSNIFLLLHYLDIYLTDDKYNLYVPYVVSLAFSCFGPCIDPFIYYYVSDDFRGKVLRVLCCCHAGQQVSSNNCDIHLSNSSQSRSTLLSKSWGNKEVVQKESAGRAV